MQILEKDFVKKDQKMIQKRHTNAHMDVRAETL